MRHAAAKTTTETTKKQAQTQSPISGLALAVQLLDTTLRVALPIIVLSLVGIQIDRHNHTKPLFTVAGLLISLIIATILVYKQIEAAYPGFFHGGNEK